MSEVISSRISELPDNPRERFLLNFADALAKLEECRTNNIPASLMLLFAHMQDADSDEAHADHTVYGDDRMHMENIAQLLFQFIDRGTSVHHNWIRQMLIECATKLDEATSLNQSTNEE